MSTDFRGISKREGYVDSTGFIKELIYDFSRWSVLACKESCGKTMLLSMLYYYLEQTEDSRIIFEKSDLARTWDEWDEHLNAYNVIVLDFSGFDERNMRGALKYISRVMQNQYWKKIKEVIDNERMFVSSNERALQILKGNPKPEDLGQSLKDLIYVCNRYERKNQNDSEGKKERFYDDRPVLLIDNMVKLDVCAERYGYKDEMCRFIREFCGFEPDKVCSFYYQVADDDIDDDESWFYGHSRRPTMYPDYVSHNSRFVRNLSEWFKDKGISKGYMDENTQTVVCAQRHRIRKTAVLESFGEEIVNQKIKYAVAKGRAWWEKKEKYAAPLPEGVARYSKNMGIRDYVVKRKNAGYEKLNKKLRDIYLSYGKSKDYLELYDSIQNIDMNKKTDWTHERRDRMLLSLNRVRDGWTASLHNHDRYWDYISVSKDRKDYCGISNIKVYVTMKNEYVSDTFIELMEKLVKSAEDGFVVKVSKYYRDENFCFWVRKNEFYIIEEYFQKHKDRLRKGLPFIAHRSYLGFSHDLMDIDSHNAQQAKLIWDYFQRVESVESVNLEEMYSLFVKGWNAELAEDDIIRKDFEGATAQMFVIMMDTLDCILSGKNLADDSFLLSDDPEAWSILGRARCWAEVRNGEIGW